MKTNFTANLPTTAAAQLTAVIAFAKQQLAADKSGHSIDHLNRVANLASAINAFEKADSFTVLATVFFA